MVDSDSWQVLTRALRDLHRALVERARSDHERDLGMALDPGHLLQLLTLDPGFQWLRSLSELMADIDTLLDAEPAARDEFSNAVRAAVEQLITPAAMPEAASAFAQRYWPYVHEDPHVAMAHAQVKRVVAAWPPSPEHEPVDARRRIAERARHHLQHQRRGS